MSLILVILIYLRVFLVMIIGLLFSIFGPFIIIGALIVLYKMIKSKLDKQRYYDYYKRHNLSPADDSKNYTDFTREGIQRERDSWL